MLSSAGQAADVLAVSGLLVERYVDDVGLWARRVALVSSLMDDTEMVLMHINAAVDACSSSKVWTLITPPHLIDTVSQL